MLIHLYISTVIAKCSCIFTLFHQILWENKSSVGWTSVRREAELPTKKERKKLELKSALLEASEKLSLPCLLLCSENLRVCAMESGRDFSQYRKLIMQQNSQVLICSGENINMRSFSTESIHWWATLNMTHFILGRLVIEIFSDICWTLLQILYFFKGVFCQYDHNVINSSLSLWKWFHAYGHVICVTNQTPQKS